jgi:hypothetical protein
MGTFVIGIFWSALPWHFLYAAELLELRALAIKNSGSKQIEILKPPTFLSKKSRMKTFC